MILQLLNTLYVQTQGAYLRLEHENIAVEASGASLLQVPLHHLGGLAVFGNVLLSPFLLHRCASDGRAVAWYTANGRYQGRLAGPTTGNVMLRVAQHEAHADGARSLELARAFVAGKLRNSRHVLLRALRDGVPDDPAVERAAEGILSLIRTADAARDVDALRGVEGTASAMYFDAFPGLLRADEPDFAFTSRNRRPPRDPVNALLSFGYALLAHECASALDGVGLDPQIGYLHALRPGRPALALDLMEEFRALIADRNALTLINRQQILSKHFERREGGAVSLTADGRRIFLQHWQEKKQEMVQHPVLESSVPIGLLPHVQSRLLARTLRQDVRRYTPFAPR